MSIPFIEFRRSVQLKINSGELNKTIDPIIYAIKERQVKEINYRVNVAKVYFKKDGEVREVNCSAQIFERSDLLDQSDFAFLIESLTSESMVNLFESLVNYVKPDEHYAEDARAQAQSLIARMQSTELEKNYVMRQLITNDLAPTLRHVYSDTLKAAQVFKDLEHEFSDKHHISHQIIYKSHIKGLGYWYERGEIGGLKRWLDVESILSDMGRHVFEARRAQIDIAGAVIDSQADVHQMLSDSRGLVAPEWNDEVCNRIDSLVRCNLEIVEKSLNAGVTSALDGFGNRNTKSGGIEVVQGLIHFADTLKKAKVDEALKQRIANLMVIKLCNGSVRTMKKESIKSFFGKVNEIADWTKVLPDLNEAGRELLLRNIGDSRCIRDHVTQAERGILLRDDMGL